jgi:hypothetical protein
MALASANTAALVKATAAQLATVDFDKMREIARVIHDHPSMMAEFEADPEGVARSINGFEVPEGLHIHMADANNNLIPAEEAGVFGAEDRDAWSRMEVRAGYKTLSLVVCI